MLEDPTAPAIYRTSGAPPYPTPVAPQIPVSINSRQVTLRDRITIASLIPFSTASQVPPRLLSYLCSQLNLEIEKGDTYPMTNCMAVHTFGTYWFQNFGAIMFLGEVMDIEEIFRMEDRGCRWEEVCLGSFYVKPNYPGRSSHVCNGGFIVTEAARNKGVGRLMGEGYLEWAPKLGYTYSVFNLVYDTNVASCRIWDALGFKRIGRVKDCGNLRSHPNQLVDAIIYGRDLGPEGEDYVSEERFDKIRFYLKHGKYPNGADRAEKSRLRSAATHYKLLPAEDGDTREDSERLMLKDKEVVSDPQRQYEIARTVHAQSHGGINKTTATIADRYHWVRIKETVSLVIKNCPDCKDTNVATRTPTARGAVGGEAAPPAEANQIMDQLIQFDHETPSTMAGKRRSDRRIPQQVLTPSASAANMAPIANMHAVHDYSGMPLDPDLMHASPHHMRSQQEFEGMRQVADFAHAAPDGHGHGHPQSGYAYPVDGAQVHGRPDTRMATERHVRRGDEPMAWRAGEGGGDGALGFGHGGS